ncbi:MAG: hypothetical protein V1747_03550 [Candidatus Omnitrophota bacterium]
MGNHNSSAQEYFDQYWKHASVLRNWFVAYGIGALALVVGGKEFFNSLVDKQLFVGAIAIAISTQVLLTFLNKIVHWNVYAGRADEQLQPTSCYIWSNEIIQKFWIDVVADSVTLLAYIIAFAIFMMNLCG